MSIGGWDMRTQQRMTPLVKAEYGYMCHLCMKEIEEGKYSVDHVIPQSKGGDSSLENLRPAHRLCNSQRQDRPISEFRSLHTDNTSWFLKLGA